jgi:hypothetical protein
MEKVQPYLYMLSTSINTIYETFLVAVIFMLSLGYSVVRTELQKEAINSMIFFMGSIYILDSIYFISTDQLYLKYTVMGIAIIFYIFLLYKVMSNTIFNIRVLSLSNEIIKYDDNMEQTSKYFLLKRCTLIIYLITTTLLLSSFIFNNLFRFFIKTDEAELFISAIYNLVEAAYILLLM